MERVTFNSGMTFWEYSTPERLAEIRAFVQRQGATDKPRPFDPQRMVTATLQAERRMMTKAPEPEKPEPKERDPFDALFAKLRGEDA